MGLGMLSKPRTSDGVIAGQLQSYCAACGIVGKNEDLQAHILTVEHKENFEKCPLVESYQLETIRKVPKGYQCECCNCLIRSLAQVKIHVLTPSHTNNNGIPQAELPQMDIQKSFDGIIAFGCIKMTDLVWNAIVKDTCVVCDVDVEDCKAHLEDEGHLINLIQAPVQSQYYYLYRKIDTSVQCLTCNIIIPEAKLENHFESTEHEAFFAKACDGKLAKRKRKTPTSDINKCLRIKNYISHVPEEKAGYCMICNWFIAYDGLTNHLKGYHHMNLLKLHNKWVQKKFETHYVPVGANENDTEGATSEKDSNNNSNNQTNCMPKPDSGEEDVPKAKQIDEKMDTECVKAVETNDNESLHSKNSAEVEQHPKGVKSGEKRKLEEVADPSHADLEKTKALADEFSIKLEASGATTCLICNKRIGSTYKEIRAHIKSITHKKNFFKSSKISPNNYDTVRMQDFHKGSLKYYNSVQCNMVINMQHYLNILSYHVFVSENGQLKCYLCNQTVQNGHEHSTLDLHKQLWDNSLMITSLGREFVREVNKGVFHCGFCNAILNEWEALLEHLMSLSHAKHFMAAEITGSKQMRGFVQNEMMPLLRRFM